MFGSKYERLLEKLFEQSKEMELLKLSVSGQRDRIDALDDENKNLAARLKEIEETDVTQLELLKSMQLSVTDMNVFYRNAIEERDKRILSLEISLEAMKTTLKPIEITTDILDEWVNGAQPKGGGTE